MPKVTMTFNLPEEHIEFEMASSSSALHSAVWEFEQWLRSRQKYGTPEASGADELATIRDQFYGDFDGLLDK